MEPMLVDGIIEIRRNTRLSACCFLLAIFVVGIGFLPFDRLPYLTLPTIISRSLGLALGLVGFSLMKINKYRISNIAAFKRAYSVNYYLQVAIFGVMLICGVAFVKLPILSGNTQVMMESVAPYAFGLLAALIIFANIRHRQIIGLYGQKVD